MSRWFSKLTLNQKLGLLALVLGVLAIFARVGPGQTITLNAKELLTSIQRQEDHVAPAELAAWIIEGRTDYRLVDIRDPSAFAEYHIDRRERSPRRARRARTATDRPLRRRRDPRGAGVEALKGPGLHAGLHAARGLDAWKDEVLFPVMPQNPTPEEQARFERTAHVAKFFGGQPRAAAGPGAEPLPLPDQAAGPAVAPPSLPAGAGGGPKKKREGC
jgi:rhodanese-related sulfurtransferase